MRSAGSCSSERDLDSDIDEEDEGTDQPLSASHVGEGLAEVPAHLASLTRLQALCLHGNSICRIDHLGGLSRLRDLNLSSNCIEAVGSGLRGLVRLTSLNLSSNNLSTVEGLEGLLELRRLNLSHNYVRSLQGLTALHGRALQFLDMRNNALDSLHEFSVLAGCPALREMLVEGGLPGNPICQQPTFGLAITAALPQLQKLDGRPVNPAEAMQYLAALHLQAFQSVQQPPAQLLLPGAPHGGGASCVGSPLRCMIPQVGNGMTLPGASPHHYHQQQEQQHAQQQGPPAARPPLQQTQGMFMAGLAADLAGPFVGQPASSGLQKPSARLTLAALPQQQQEQSVLPSVRQAAALDAAMADAEWQMQQLLSAWPQLVGPLMQALRSVDAAPAPSQLPGTSSSAVEEPSTLKQPTSLAPTSTMQLSSPTIAGDTVANERGTFHCTSSYSQTEAVGPSVEQLQRQVAELQAEVEALNAELEVQGQSATRADKEAAVAVSQATEQAERQIVQAKQQAETAVQQARQGLAEAQDRYKALEAALAESQSQQAVSYQRQQDLEYELGRAWEELERAEGSLQQQRVQHEVAVQQQESQLAQAHQEAQRFTSAIAEASAKQEALQRQVAEQQSLLSRLQSERDTAVTSSSRQCDELQQQLGAARAQLGDQTQQLSSIQARENEAREQLKQLSTTLAAVHEEHDSVMAALKRQQDQELRELAAERVAAVSAALEDRDAVQRRLASTEAEFRCALQEGAKEVGDLRRDLELLAGESVELRGALQEEHRKRKEAEAMVVELTEVVQHQKLRMRGLAQEKADIAARLAAMNPQELDRVRSELLTLRERAGELGAIRDQLVQERRLAESLQQRLAAAQQQLVDAREEAVRKVATADAALRSAQEEAARKVMAAEAAAAEITSKAEQLSDEASRLRDAVKVKEAMLDSANERIVELKSAAAAAQAAAEEAHLAADEAEEELRAREGNDSDKLGSLRAEIEAQEQVIEQLDRKLADSERRQKEAERRASTAEQAATEKENMINYVGEEVERVKGMFEQKEARLAQERDAARKDAAQLLSERDTLSAMVRQLESSAKDLAAQLREEQSKAATALQAAGRQQAEATRATARVADVECELREVLGVLEQHKAASAAKFQQLQSVLQDLSGPFMQLPL